jgi:DNA polymerase-3 subunit gamma/tau
VLPALGIEKVLIGDEPRISSATEGRLPTLPDSIFAASIIDFGSFESLAETASKEPSVQKVQKPQMQEEPIKPVEVQESKTDIGHQYFEKLIAALNDRSAELGKCFSENIYYLSFEDNLLTWESCATGECKEKLRHGWGVIKHFVQDIFGFDTKIKNNKCTKANEEQNSSTQTTDASSVKQVIKNVEQIVKKDNLPAQEEINTQALQEPASMIEDEIMDGSCVSGCGGDDPSRLDEASKEIDAASIMDEPMILKAKEMFEATKITIQSKI